MRPATILPVRAEGADRDVLPHPTPYGTPEDSFPVDGTRSKLVSDMNPMNGKVLIVKDLEILYGVRLYNRKFYQSSFFIVVVDRLAQVLGFGQLFSPNWHIQLGRSTIGLQGLRSTRGP